MTVTPSRPAQGRVAFPIAALDRRFYAFAVDRALAWILIAAASAAGWFLTEDWRIAVAAGVGVMVVVWLALAVVAGVKGTSPGKALTHLRLVHQGSGTPIGVGRSLLRSFVLGASAVPTLGLGLVTLAWTALEDRDRQRRGWHDHLGKSVVVDVRPADQHDADDGASAPRHVVNLTAMRLVPAPAMEVHLSPRRVNPGPAQPRETGQPQQSTQPPQSGPVRPSTPSAGPSAGPAAGPAAGPITGPSHPPAVPNPPVARGPLPGEGQRAARQPDVPPVAPPQGVQPPAASYEEQRTVIRGRHARALPTWRVTFDDGMSFIVEGHTLIGRRPEPRAGEHVHRLVPLGSHDMSVSKTHAQFGPASDGALVVMDRGSTNGSSLQRRGVNKPLPPGQPMTLIEGDQVTFGDRSMIVVREG